MMPAGVTVATIAVRLLRPEKVSGNRMPYLEREAMR
jgi:hypothetical protein